MAILANQTIVGTIGNVYELRTVGQDNRKVIDFSVAVTPRRQVNGEWTDGETYWVNVTAWNRLAENIAESFRKGDRVFIHGRTDMKASYTNKEGVEVPARPFVTADFAGLEVSFAAAHSTRQPSGRSSESYNRGGGNGGGYNNGGGNGGNRSQGNGGSQRQSQAPAVDEDDLGFDEDSDFSPF